MSLPNIPFVGPITQDMSVILVSVFAPGTTGFTGTTGYYPAFLNSTIVDNSTTYYWETDANRLTQGSLPIFNLKHGATGLKLIDTTNQGGLSYNNDFLINAIAPADIIFQQYTYAEWPAPTILLSNVYYEMWSPSKDILTSYIGNELSYTGSNDSVMILPVTWYTQCQQGNFQVVNQPLESVTSWQCLVNNKIQGCNNDMPIAGFTRHSDCEGDLIYSYCLKNAQCGGTGPTGGNCNGPCGVDYDICVSNKNAQYTCVVDPLKYLTEGPWWKSTWFIISVVIVGVLVVALIAGIIALGAHEKKKNPDLLQNLASPDSN